MTRAERDMLKGLEAAQRTLQCLAEGDESEAVTVLNGLTRDQAIWAAQTSIDWVHSIIAGFTRGDPARYRQLVAVLADDREEGVLLLARMIFERDAPGRADESSRRDPSGK